MNKIIIIATITLFFSFNSWGQSKGIISAENEGNSKTNILSDNVGKCIEKYENVQVPFKTYNGKIIYKPCAKSMSTSMRSSNYFKAYIGNTFIIIKGSKQGQVIKINKQLILSYKLKKRK